MWRGLTVAPENRCSDYSKRHYPYRQSVELGIINRMGGRICGPYTGRTFSDRSETDIEHIVATSEAHDSGMCAMDAATKRRFASDLDNLTLASPGVNRHQKSGKDAGEWLPERNLCWFANQVVSVKRKYSLSVDSRERNALERVLSGCSSTVMDILDTGGAPRADASVQEAPVPAPSLMPAPVTPPPVRPQPDARPKERKKETRLSARGRRTNLRGDCSKPGTTVHRKRRRGIDPKSHWPRE